MIIVFVLVYEDRLRSSIMYAFASYGV